MVTRKLKQKWHNKRGNAAKERIARIGGLSCKQSTLSILGKNKLSDAEIKLRLKRIKDSNIDLTRYGWVTKIAKLLVVTHTHVKRFINKYYDSPIYRRGTIEV